LFAVFFMLALGGMAAALATLSGNVHKEHEEARGMTRSFYAAEAGVNEAFSTLVAGAEPALQATAYPRSLSTMDYSVLADYGATHPDIRLDRIRLHSVGDAGTGPEGVQLMVYKVPTGFFNWGIFGDRYVQLNSNVLIDSYNSADGPYSGQNGDFGNVGSNGDITLDANVQTWGDVMTGPTGTLDDSAPQVDVSGTLGSNEELEVLDPIVVPSFPTSGNLNVPSSTFLGAGDYHFDSVNVNGTLTVQGPARIVVDDMLLQSNAEWVIDATNGPVEIYGTGDFDLRSNSTLTTNSQRARDVSIMISSTNIGPNPSNISLNSNSDFVGTVYAPNADIVVSSNFEIFGAIKAGSVELASNAQLHFDEDLLYDPGVPPIFERVSWRRLSRQEITALGF